MCALLEAGERAQAWRIADARICAVFLFSGSHGIVDAAHGKQSRIKRRLSQNVERLFFSAVGLPPI